MSFDGLDISILGPAFIAGLLVLATHVPLGQEVLKRGIIFIDLAIAQIAGLGVVIASRFGGEAHGWEVQLTAMVSALLGAWLLSRMEKKWKQRQEALIGVTFVLAATASILLLADNPHGGDSLKQLLVGQILWVTWDQLIIPALFSALILGVWFKVRHHDGYAGFYLLFAIAVTVSVQLVGIYLVFASLIVPSLGAVGLSGRRALLQGYLIGVFGYGLGLVASAIFDLPSGAVIVWVIVVVSLVGRVFIKDSKTIDEGA